VVTSAPLTLEQERSLRERRYAWTMGLRTVMFIIAISVPMPIWLRLVVIVASMVLPWFAVVAANQPQKRVHGVAVLGPGVGAAQPAAPQRLEGVRVVEGELSGD
jgi:hypothetical protein